MRAYARGGRGRAYWLTLPAPRGASSAAAFPPVRQRDGCTCAAGAPRPRGWSCGRSRREQIVG